MNTTELKKLAEAATPGPWIAGDDEDSDYFLVGPHDGDGLVFHPVVTLHTEANADYIAAANPAAILKLLAINAELVEALKACMNGCEFRSIGGDSPAWHQKQMPSNEALNKARAALAKSEGGEL
jgi:hypothetical protein